MLSNPNKVLWKKVFRTNNSDPETIPRLYKIVISKKLNKNTGAVLGSWNVFNSLECKNELITVAFSSRKLQVRVKCVWNALDCVISWEVLLLLVRQVGRVHLLLQPLLHPRILRPTPGSIKMFVFACCRIIPNVFCGGRIIPNASFCLLPDHSKCFCGAGTFQMLVFACCWIFLKCFCGDGSFQMFLVWPDHSKCFFVGPEHSKCLLFACCQLIPNVFGGTDHSKCFCGDQINPNVFVGPDHSKCLFFAGRRIIPNVCCLLAAGSFQMFFVGPDHSKCYYAKFWNLEMHYLLYWGAGSFLMFCPFVVTDNSEGFW